MIQEPVVITGALRPYDWGRVNGLSHWTGAGTDGPEAELWFGCHPAAPSPLSEHPDVTLAQAWGTGEAPVLVKLLAAESPLSLQVHPEADLAARWLVDPETADLLTDPAEKTEMLVAIEPFLVLVGWRPARDAGRLMAAVGAAPEVVAAAAGGDPCAAVLRLLTDRPVSGTREGWRQAVRAAGLDDTAEQAMDAVSARFGTDPGVAVAALLQSCRLESGDAAYLPAGIPHAYVSGLGVEVMTSSDNVLRMGLTAKRMSVEHTLAAIDPSRRVTVLRAPADHVYSPPGSPFTVTVAQGPPVVAGSTTYRLVLAVFEQCEVVVGSRSFMLSPGQALALPAGAAPARVCTDGRAVVVTAAWEAS